MIYRLFMETRRRYDNQKRFDLYITPNNQPSVIESESTGNRIKPK